MCVCVRLHSENSEPMYHADFSRRLTNTPDATALTMASSHLYRPSRSFSSFGAAFCDVLFRSSCLFEHTYTAVCALPEYHLSCKYNVYSNIL